jgi:hypothetical protein
MVNFDIKTGIKQIKAFAFNKNSERKCLIFFSEGLGREELLAQHQKLFDGAETVIEGYPFCTHPVVLTSL